VPEIESKGFEDTVIYDLCKKAAVEPLFEEKNAKYEDAAIDWIEERFIKGIKTTKKDVLNFLKEHREPDNPELEEKDIELIEGDFKDIMPAIPSESYDFVFTDPPYDLQSLDLWEDLARESERILKPGGFLISYASPNTLPLTLDSIGAHLTYYWTIAIVHTHGQARFWKYKFWRGWKPLLVFVKGDREGAKHEWVNDAIQIGESEAKDRHEWSQPEVHAEIIIKAFCPDKSRAYKILDPMCGAATIPIAAAKLGHEAMGIEKDETRFKTAKGRISNDEASI
jgi:site-specific DNA-methyltransferase (adenine-specific)